MSILDKIESYLGLFYSLFRHVLSSFDIDQGMMVRRLKKSR